jgi:hypothetical protein
LTQRGELETVGMARLQAGFAETLAGGGDAQPHLDEAAELAGRLADAPTGPSTARNKTFGPANVALWQLTSAVERREPGEALRLAETLDPTDLPKGSRHALYFVETGRAYAMKRDQRAALHALLRAEHAAPQHVRGLAPVRELVGAMLREARRDLATGELGKLAQRVRVVPV